MKKHAVNLITGLIGGLIAISVYLLVAPLPHAEQFEKLSSGERLPVQQTSYSFNPDKEIIAPDFGVAAEKSVHAVVHIKTEFHRGNGPGEEYFDFRDFFGRRGFRQPLQGSASGVIVDSEGYIVTNNHVVEEASNITVTLNDKRSYAAEVVGLDPNTDLALIRIEAENLPYLAMGDSDELSIGEWVLAVGNPFNLTSTVTAGIVSAKARNINILGRRGGIESFIQTDAAVNRGNSGGALVNTKGELVGINAAIASQTGTYTGYSFAIPVNIAQKVIQDLKEYGEVQRAIIGVNITDINSELAEKYDIDNLEGVYIQEVEDNSAAEKSGIKDGDIILSVDGKPVNSSGRLLGLIALYDPGDKVELEIRRNDDVKKIEVTLQSESGETKLVPAEEKSTAAVLGAQFETLPPEKCEELGIDHGVQVVDLSHGKLRSAGVRKGFIITGIDRKNVETAEELEKRLEKKEGGVLIEGVYPNGLKAYYGFGL
ncbi:MAG: Do family serine endopeptidase [Bacteroidales bacterium]